MRNIKPRDSSEETNSSRTCLRPDSQTTGWARRDRKQRQPQQRAPERQVAKKRRGEACIIRHSFLNIPKYPFWRNHDWEARVQPYEQRRQKPSQRAMQKPWLDLSFNYTYRLSRLIEPWKKQLTCTSPYVQGNPICAHWIDVVRHPNQSTPIPATSLVVVSCFQSVCGLRSPGFTGIYASPFFMGFIGICAPPFFAPASRSKPKGLIPRASPVIMDITESPTAVAIPVLLITLLLFSVTYSSYCDLIPPSNAPYTRTVQALFQSSYM